MRRAAEICLVGSAPVVVVRSLAAVLVLLVKRAGCAGRRDPDARPPVSPLLLLPARPLHAALPPPE